MGRVSVSTVVEFVSREAFGKPLISNSLRSMVVEAMLALALPEGWRWCGADWAGWDLEHADGTRLEVKQTAARQTWPAPARRSRPTFDIAARTGHWEGASWIAGVGRKADIYVLAHHPVTDDSADHRESDQWRFHVIPAGALPDARSISLPRVEALAASVGYGEVATSIEAARVRRR